MGIEKRTLVYLKHNFNNKYQFNVVLNRQPYVLFKKRNQCFRPPGGATVLNEPFAILTNANWFAWRDKSLESGCKSDLLIGFPEEFRKFNLVLIELSQREIENYYYGFCNQSILPINLGQINYAVFQDSFHDYYHKVNQKFSSDILKTINLERENLFLVNDHHFYPQPDLF